MCLAQLGNCLKKQWKPSLKLPKFSLYLELRSSKLFLENKLICPFLGDAYHHVIRLLFLILSSKANVENKIRLSSAMASVKFFISIFTSGKCSKTSNAVIKSNFPKSFKLVPLIGNGS